MKRPAEILHAELIKPERDLSHLRTISAPSQEELQARVILAYRAGRIQKGEWHARKLGNEWKTVVVLAPPKPWIARHKWKIIGATVVTAGLCAAGYIAAQFTMRAFTTLAVILAIAAIPLAVANMLGRGGQTITVVQKVNVRGR